MKPYNPYHHGLRNPHRDDPSKRPPAGWKARNWVYQQIVARAQRLGVQALTDQLSKFESVRREDQIVILMLVEKAINGLLDPQTMNLTTLLAEYREQNPVHSDRLL